MMFVVVRIVGGDDRATWCQDRVNVAAPAVNRLEIVAGQPAFLSLIMQHGFVVDGDPQLAVLLDQADDIGMGRLGRRGEFVNGSLECSEFADDERGRAEPVRLDGHCFAAGTGELPMRLAAVGQQKCYQCAAALVLPGIDPQQVVGGSRLAKRQAKAKRQNKTGCHAPFVRRRTD